MDYLMWMLKEVKTEKLAEWWDAFSSWEYPEDFPISKPDNWDGLEPYSSNTGRQTKYRIITPYMSAIVRIIGRKECMRYHHLHNLGMSNFQFEVWWALNPIFPNIYDNLGWRKWRK